MTVSSRPMILSVLVAVATIPARARADDPPPSPTTTAAVSAAAAPPPGAATAPVPAVARAEEAIPSPPALPASATHAATAPAATATAPALPASTIAIAGLDKLSVSGGAILWYYQPLTSGGQNDFDLYYANVVLDGKAGQVGLHVDPRLRATKLRPYYDGPAWVEEAYVYGDLGPVTLKAGKVYQQLGLFWDDSFYGSVLVYDGIKLAPDYGVSAEGTAAVTPRSGVRYWAQYFVADGQTNVSLPGRDTISIPGARRRNEIVGRIEPFARLGGDTVVKLGASAERFRADLPEVKNTVWRAGGDATIKTTHAGAWLEYLYQRGKSVDGFPIAPIAGSDAMPVVPGQASGHNHYLLAGASYSYGRLTARYNVSWVDYRDLDIRETLHEPAVSYAISAKLFVLAELVRWHRAARAGDVTVDDSLNVTLHASF